MWLHVYGRRTFVDEAISKLYGAFDASPRRTVRFEEVGDSELDAYATVFPLTLEPDVRTVVLVWSFRPNIGSVLNWLIVKPNRLRSLEFSAYDMAVSVKGLETRRASPYRLGTVRFVTCAPEFIVSFLMAVKRASFSLHSVVFKTVRWMEAAVQMLRNCLQGGTVFQDLAGLAFVACSIQDDHFRAVVQRVIQAKNSLVSLRIENCGVEIPEVPSSIQASRATQLQHICLR
jgi:hypothetical protein